MHVDEYVCILCHKELTIFLKCWESFEHFLQPVTLIKMLLIHKYFPVNFLRPSIFQSISQWQLLEYAVSHQYQQYDGILIYNMVYSSKVFFLLQLTNLRTFQLKVLLVQNEIFLQNKNQREPIIYTCTTLFQKLAFKL